MSSLLCPREQHSRGSCLSRCRAAGRTKPLDATRLCPPPRAQSLAQLPPSRAARWWAGSWARRARQGAPTHTPSGGAEQWKQVFRVVPALPPFFPSVPWQGGLWDGLRATTHMGQKGNLCWVACLLHPRHLLEVTPLCSLESTLGSQGKFRGMRERMYSAVSALGEHAWAGGVD